jgi:large subunit ribosomal protein L6
MSRIANNPVVIPKGVEVALDGRQVSVKGPKGSLSWEVHPWVEVTEDDGALSFKTRNRKAGSTAQAGTARALVNNMVKGVSDGFTRKLELVGVGYRAQVQGSALNLTLGFSHPVSFPIPEGITIKTPSPTEILIEGADKQAVGQVAANIRRYRPPEPYKGKGIKYSDERIVRKEAKKK